MSLTPLIAGAPPLNILAEFIVACVGCVLGWLLVSRRHFFWSARWLLPVAVIGTIIGNRVGDGRGIVTFMAAWLGMSFTLLLVKPPYSDHRDSISPVERDLDCNQTKF